MKQEQVSAYHLGEWVVDPLYNTLSKDGQSRHLEPLAMDVLMYLMARAFGTINTREKFLDKRL